MVEPEIIESSPRIEALLAPFENNFPLQTDFKGYLHHCVRMLNVALALSEDAPNRLQKLEIALAYHDLTIFPDKTLDYLESSVVLAGQHLAAIGRQQWMQEIALMINMHHKIGAYKGRHENLVEAFRKADWLDVTFGQRRYGLPRAWIKNLHETLPLYTFPKTVFSLIPIYMFRHPRKPLPNFRFR